MEQVTLSHGDAATAIQSSINKWELLRSVILNAVIPYILYILAKKYFSASELEALSIASLFPIFDSIFSFIKNRSFDLIAVITLLSIVVSIIAIFLGGSPKLLLIRESFFTGALGIICFISLLLPRPLMFYFGRQILAGSNKTKITAFNARWEYPHVRFFFRLITAVWGVAFLGDFILRAVFVYAFPSAVVLLISPFVSAGITIGTIMWSLTYAHHAMKHWKGAHI